MILAFFLNSMIFPGLENAFFIFQVFHDFPGRWEPWSWILIKQSCTVLLVDHCAEPAKLNWTRTTATRASLKLILRGWGTVLAGSALELKSSYSVGQSFLADQQVVQIPRGPGYCAGWLCLEAERCFWLPAHPPRVGHCASWLCLRAEKLIVYCSMGKVLPAPLQQNLGRANQASTQATYEVANHNKT